MLVYSVRELCQAVKAARAAKIPYFIMGTGANILISDKGFKGLVILNQSGNFRFSKSKLVAESGAVMSDLIAACQRQGLSGLEHYSGIPSSVGGALWQNLHFLSPDRQSTLYIAEVVESAKIFDGKNRLRKVGKSFFKFAYDDSILHHRRITVLEVTFSLTPKAPQAIAKQIKANLAWRRAKQPQLVEYASCGSVFKKIAGVGAGRLIDSAGLKGVRVGQAQVSPKHANYIVNLGRATAADVSSLMKFVQQEVKAQTGYDLEPEISFIGEK